MMSPRSFLYSSRPRPPPTPPSPTLTPSTLSPYTATGRLSSSTTSIPSTPSTPSPLPAAAAPSLRPKHDESRPGSTTVTVTPVSAPPRPAAGRDLHVDMGKRKDRRGPDTLAPASPPNTPATTVMTRPLTPTSPVQIPNKQANRETAHPPKRHHHTAHHAHHAHHRRQRDVHSPDSISPSVAALLAVTDIPRPRAQTQRRRRRSDKPLTLGEIIDRQHVSEKELSWSLGRGPMDMLLSPPEDLGDDDMSVSGSAMSTRTVSADSIPSLGGSFATDLASSLDTPGSPSPSSRGRRASPMRKSLEPVRSPSDAADEHPLAAQRIDLDEVDFQMLQPAVDEHGDAVAKSQLLGQFKPLKSAFKSNLTASLRALRSAAKSFSTLNFPVTPPDDLLTRSMLTMDPKVPYTDERRPPVSEEMPSAELRRYLNPTTSSRIETQPSTPPPGTFSASIQMQTYKVHRSRSAPPAPRSAPSPPQASAYQPQPQSPTQTAFSYPPGMRQREMRENSDFIRIAVMEMAMRKRGKLDDQRPGRARWALPARKMSMKAYEVTNGVPARWTPVSY